MINLKKKDIIIITICLVIIVLSIGGYLGVKYYLDKDLEKAEQELQNTIEKYGVLERESVNISVAKFNTEIMDNTGWELLPVSDNSMIIHENNYWYPLYEDISLVVVPEEFTNDNNKDVTKIMFLYFPKDTKYMNEAMEYMKYLIKANNEKITDEDATKLISEAEELKQEQKSANNGTGIWVGIYENDTHIEYQVSRNY